MENAVAEIKTNNKPSREISVITEEIRDICKQAQTMALLYAVEIGRRLEEAKVALPYGKWGEWLKNEVEFSQSAANNFMRLFREYGSSQISIFGASIDSQTFANLPYSKALQLLAIPKDEREAFAEEVDAESLSVKELKVAIAERDAAKKAVEEAKAREEQIAERLAQAEKATEEAKKQIKETEDLKAKFKKLESELKDTKAKTDILKEKLKAAENDPKIPKEKIDQIRKELEESIKKDEENTVKQELERAKEKIEAAEAKEIAARLSEKQALERLEEAQKKLKTASPEITAFKVLFDSLQSTASKLKEMLDKIHQEDPATADKLRNALKVFAATIS